MHTWYSLLMKLVEALLPVIALYSPKLKKSVQGRRETFDILTKKLTPGQPTIWMHTASLGEYEQGVPVIEALKNHFPEHQWVITFFSPSGYEVKKNNAFAKATVYLPLDTTSNVSRFLDIVTPEMAFFVKYEFWPNYLKALKNSDTRTFLISGVFRQSQPFFKSYGRWMLPSLDSFEHFFLQNEASAEALRTLGLTNYTVSGDTRFDRVSQQIAMNNTLPFMEGFKENKITVVCGSTWPAGEELITTFINADTSSTKFVIAPHEIKLEKIEGLKRSLNVETVLYSTHTHSSLRDAKVLILDTVGLLTKVYSYADIAYVGGAVGTTGLHNILEPATFGVPILIGKNFDKFIEAKLLQQLAGLYAVSSQQEFNERLKRLIDDKNFRSQTGMIAGHFINSNTGATKAVVAYLKM